jgi:predicted metal-dependent enzyme (double-stranded beta helix superfamily)|tara:strand:+ start:86 stop:661 length:576 start_codon:yes stop_codon:yes gene_type:complete
MVEAAKDAVKSFISSMRDLYTEKLEAAEHWARARDLLEVLVLNEEFQKMTDAWPTGDGKQYVIYEDPDYGFVIDGLVRGSYHAAPAHDHAHTWTAYGIVTGWERMTRYIRMDDGTSKDRAEIKLVSSEICDAGTVDVIPPWEIHTESNDDNRAVALSVRSETLGHFDQNIYLEDGRITTIRGLERINFPIT